jgi:hypothetical protein
MVLLSSSLLLTGCLPSRGKEKMEKGEIVWVDHDVNSRGSFVFLDNNGKLKVLSEPPPDATKLARLLTEIAADVKTVEGTSVDAKAKLEYNQSLARVAQTSVAGDILRHAAYRLSEIQFNSKDGVPDQAVLNQFDKIVEAARLIAIASLAGEANSAMQKLRETVDSLPTEEREAFLNKAETFFNQ